MRINRFLALTTKLSRRKADEAIASGRIFVNGQRAVIGQEVSSDDTVQYDAKTLQLDDQKITIMLHKSRGYICSRDGQGSRTIYSLLPAELHYLNPVGRLDKESSGLLLLTNDGELAHKLTHPSYKKEKVYEVTTSKPVSDTTLQQLTKGVELEDGISKFDSIAKNSETEFRITLHEGRNRQIRRTFESLGYSITRLHRTQFGEYVLGNLKTGQLLILPQQPQ